MPELSSTVAPQLVSGDLFGGVGETVALAERGTGRPDLGSWDYFSTTPRHFSDVSCVFVYSWLLLYSKLSVSVTQQKRCCVTFCVVTSLSPPISLVTPGRTLRPRISQHNNEQRRRAYKITDHNSTDTNSRTDKSNLYIKAVITFGDKQWRTRSLLDCDTIIFLARWRFERHV